jgi:hypothetical protein
MILPCKFQAVIVDRLELNWRVVVPDVTKLSTVSPEFLRPNVSKDHDSSGLCLILDGSLRGS